MELKSKATLSNDFESSLNYGGKLRHLDFRQKKGFMRFTPEEDEMGLGKVCDNLLSGKPLMFLIGFVLAAFGAAQLIVGVIEIKPEG